MSTYLHPDLDDLRARLKEAGFVEAPQRHDDFSLAYAKGDDLIIIDLPDGEVYEHVEVHFHLGATLQTEMLQLLGFPL